MNGFGEVHAEKCLVQQAFLGTLGPSERLPGTSLALHGMQEVRGSTPLSSTTEPPRQRGFLLFPGVVLDVSGYQLGTSADPKRIDQV